MMNSADAALEVYFKNLGRISELDIAQILEGENKIAAPHAYALFKHFDAIVDRIMDRLHSPSLPQCLPLDEKRRFLGDAVQGYADESIETLWNYANWCTAKGR